MQQYILSCEYATANYSNTGRGTLYSGTIDCLTKTVKHEGFSALYKGWLPTWMRMAPLSLTFFLSFEQLIRVAGLDSF